MTPERWQQIKELLFAAARQMPRTPTKAILISRVNPGCWTHCHHRRIR
jgi:hypothetical protein